MRKSYLMHALENCSFGNNSLLFSLSTALFVPLCRVLNLACKRDKQIRNYIAFAEKSFAQSMASAALDCMGQCFAK